MTDDERTITFQELVWEDIGWAKLTEAQKIEWIEQRLAMDGAGTLEPPLGDGNRKSLLGLYAKLKGDKKAMELTLKQPIEELKDAELVAALNALNRYLTGAAPADGVGETRKPAQAR